jgi:hypothetical protein
VAASRAAIVAANRNSRLVTDSHNSSRSIFCITKSLAKYQSFLYDSPVMKEVVAVVVFLAMIIFTNKRTIIGH